MAPKLNNLNDIALLIMGSFSLKRLRQKEMGISMTKVPNAHRSDFTSYTKRKLITQVPQTLVSSPSQRLRDGPYALHLPSSSTCQLRRLSGLGLLPSSVSLPSASLSPKQHVSLSPRPSASSSFAPLSPASHDLTLPPFFLLASHPPH